MTRCKIKLGAWGWAFVLIDSLTSIRLFKIDISFITSLSPLESLICDRDVITKWITPWYKWYKGVGIALD